MSTPEPITITYHQAVKAGACHEALDLMCASDIIGGDWGRFGRERDIRLTTIWDVLGEADMWWALGAVHPWAFGLLVSDMAAHVHHTFDLVFPEDSRPRDAIGVVRALGTAAAADEAARTAASDAAANAADAASWVARLAGAAEADAAAKAAEAARIARAAAVAGAADAATWAIRSAAAFEAAEAAWAARTIGAYEAARAADAASWAVRAVADTRVTEASIWATRAAAAANCATATGAAERDWQSDHIRAVLSGERAAGEVEITMHAPPKAEVAS